MSINPDEAGRAKGIHYDGDLRAGLIEAAVAELTEVGLDRLSLRGVARRAGVSHAAPAHHFTDKAGLLTAIATQGFEQFGERLRAVPKPITTTPAGPPSTALPSLAELGHAYLTFAAEHPGHFDIMFRPALLHAEDPAFLRASRSAYLALRDHVACSQADGWRPDEDLDALTTAAWGLVHGLSVLRVSGALDATLPGATSDDLLAVAASLIGPVEA